MKRKILILLLALTLALSLMPMMAFADNGTVTDSEGILSRKAIVTRITGRNISVSELKKAAGQRGPQICTHPSTDVYKYYDFNEDECTIIDRGDYHEVTGDIREITHCKKCREDLDEIELGYTTVTEGHDYEDGECWICHHKNTCPHPPTDYYYAYYDDDESTVIDRGDYHEVKAWINKVTYCRVCGDTITVEVFEKNTVSEEHIFNIGGVCEECGHLNDETRLYGSSRYDTAVTVANRYKKITGSKFENVIVANGQNYPDALSGGYLAKKMNAPILLVSPSVEDYIINYIDENIADKGTVYILGGTGVVSQAFENKLEAKGILTDRLGGKDRYETNLDILGKAKVDDEEILVCSTSGYADSLSASAVGKPILLVGSTLTEGQKEYIQSLSKKEFYLIGGTGVVTEKVEAELGDLGTVLDRIWGMTRFETSAKVARKFFPETDNVVLTYANNFPDGLSGGPLAQREEAPIILADPYNTEAAKVYVKSAGTTSNLTLGGPSLITDIAVEVIMGN